MLGLKSLDAVDKGMKSFKKKKKKIWIFDWGETVVPTPYAVLAPELCFHFPWIHATFLHEWGRGRILNAHVSVS